MRTNFLFMILLICTAGINAQPYAGFEQYTYIDKKGVGLLIPVIYFQDKKGWYVESHLNYETAHTSSIYGGKAFSHVKALSYTITPMIGVVAGSLQGGVLGLNTEMNYKNLFFNSQSQYICSFNNKSVDFLYSWIELGYRVFGVHLIGLALQHTMRSGFQMKPETGLFIKFVAKKWSFPLYCFNTYGESRYWVLGVCREFSLPSFHNNSLPGVKPITPND
jgi:hypothetical protein